MPSATAFENRAIIQWMGTGTGAEHAGSAVFYRFQDRSGRVHVVDSLDSVPQTLRPQAQRIEYGEQADAPIHMLGHEPSRIFGHEPSHWQTFGLGFAAALATVFLFSRLPGTLRLVLRLAIVGGFVALLSGAYLGWMRRASHQSDEILATPGALIDDAKSAVDKMNARIQAEQAELKEIEQAK